MLFPIRMLQSFAVPWEQSVPTSYSGFTCLCFPQPAYVSHDTYTVADLEILKSLLKAIFPKTSACILINSVALKKKEKNQIYFKWLLSEYFRIHWILNQENDSHTEQCYELNLVFQSSATICYPCWNVTTGAVLLNTQPVYFSCWSFQGCIRFLCMYQVSLLIMLTNLFTGNKVYLMPFLPISQMQCRYSVFCPALEIHAKLQ